MDASIADAMNLSWHLSTFRGWAQPAILDAYCASGALPSPSRYRASR
jgi:hypothetical protein